ncbi:MAG: DNA repair protein RadC, partial [Thiohalocapsa sp.]
MSRRFQSSDQRGYYVVNGPVSSAEIVTMARTLLKRRFARGTAITSPEQTKEFLTLHLGPLQHEVFACLFLDSRHRVIAYRELFRGTIDGASVHPREVVREAMRTNAAAVIFAHNHPSGEAEPSQADLRITQQLKDALALVDVRVLDHF